MVNYKDEAVWVGSTREDEMCNFYLMYWIDGQKKISFSFRPQATY